jgi:hypothetical protein
VNEAALLREIHGLRAQIQALHVHITADHARRSIRYGWLKVLVHDLEYNPRTQYSVHLVAVWFWVINLPLIIAIFVFLPGVWLQLGLFVTLLYSLWANFATDYGAMSAALAASQQPPLPEIPLEERK